MKLIILESHLWDDRTPTRTALEAAEIAQGFARCNRIDWGEPIGAYLSGTREGVLSWTVSTRWPEIGGNLTVIIADATGEIVDWKFYPA